MSSPGVLVGLMDMLLSKTLGQIVKASDMRSVAEIAEKRDMGQFDFAYFVSTNYWQYHIWYC